MLSVINDTGILVVILAIVLLFGASRIPKLARNLGEASNEFKKAQGDPPAKAPRSALPASDRPETVTMTRDQLDALLASAAAGRPEPAPTQNH